MSDLFEARQAPLYHFMARGKVLDVLRTDTLTAAWTHEIDGRDLTGTSLTRNAKLNWGNSIVRLTLDQDRLSRRFKIIPLDGERAFRRTRGFPDDGPDRVKNSERKRDLTLSEEFLIGNVPSLHVYVTDVYFFTNPSGYLTPDQTRDMYSKLAPYCDKFGLPLRVSPFVQTELTELNRAA